MRSRPRQQRYCRCGTHLAADNADRQCARCQRSARDKLISPPEVPAEFWQTQQFRDAFAAQHVGRIARAYRLNPHHHAVYGSSGISQGLLGQWLGLTQPQISRIETGSPVRNLDTLGHWARVLRIPSELLWFDLLSQNDKDLRHRGDPSGDLGPGSARTTEQASVRVVASSPALLGSTSLNPLLHLTGEDGEDIMKRRVFLLSSGALAGLGLGTTTSTLEAVRHGLDHLLADERIIADVDEWQETALNYGQTYLATEPATLLQTLMVDLHGVQLAIHRHPNEAAQRQLLQVGALLAAFTAQTVGNMGSLLEARCWWRTARRAADEAGDPYTVLWVRGREVVRAGYERRPARVVLQLVQETEGRLDGAPPEVLPEFFAGKAQTFALVGRHVAAEQALDQVRESFEKLPASTGHQDSCFDWGEENLRYTESFVYSHAGDFTRAERAQQAALALYPDSNVRAPAQIELQRALCLVRSGDGAQGTRHAQSVITNLPVMHRIRPVADLGQKVFEAIPAHECRQGWVQEYNECLRASLPDQAI